MNDKETAEEILEWCEGNHGPFSWPTDRCGYDQHMRFVRHRNKNWKGGPDFKGFAREYALSLLSGGDE